jgi:hypothetical protein
VSPPLLPPTLSFFGSTRHPLNGEEIEMVSIVERFDPLLDSTSFYGSRGQLAYCDFVLPSLTN